MNPGPYYRRGATPHLIIPEALVNEMIAHAKEAYPKEACGILAGRADSAERLYRMTNSDNSEATYMMEPKEQFRVMKEIRNSGLEMTAIYHSHPGSPAYPSPRDIQLASYPDSAYVIISLAKDQPVINAFLIEEGLVKQIKIDRRPL